MATKDKDEKGAPENQGATNLGSGGSGAPLNEKPPETDPEADRKMQMLMTENAAQNRAAMGGAAPGTVPGREPETAEQMQTRIDNQFRQQEIAREEKDRMFVADLHRQHQEQVKLRPLPPIIDGVTAAIARPDEDTVLMSFPKPIFIWAEPDLDRKEPHFKNRYKVVFPAGVNEVPVSLKDNWYLQQAGVREIRRERDREETRK